MLFTLSEVVSYFCYWYFTSSWNKYTFYTENKIPIILMVLLVLMNYNETNYTMEQSTTLLRKLTVAQLNKTIPMFYRT